MKGKKEEGNGGKEQRKKLFEAVSQNLLRLPSIIIVNAMVVYYLYRNESGDVWFFL